MTFRCSCAGCGCPTSAATPPRSSRPRRPNGGNPSRSYGPCSVKKPPAGNAPPSPPAAPPPGSPPARHSTRGTPQACSIPTPTQQALRTLEWIHRRENLVVCGPSGTGKTFLLEALGQHAVEHGLKVAWFTLEDLGILLRRHRADDTVTRAITRVLRADLVVVDDIGLLPVAHDAAEGLYRLVDAAYEKRSIAISSNLHPASFDELMPKTLATATVDRLLHHAHICQTTGDSIRLTQALTGQGVNPLT